MKELVEAILQHQFDKKFGLVLTGGGSIAVSELLQNGGASKVFLGAIIPYDCSVTSELLGYTPDKFTTKEVARDLAACDFGLENVLTVSCTASLVKDGEREGREHVAYIAVRNGKCTNIFSLAFKEERTRLEEETLLAKVILACVDQYLNLRKMHFTNSKEWLGLTEKDEIKTIRWNEVDYDNASPSEESVQSD